jgi:dCMP deaminase
MTPERLDQLDEVWLQCAEKIGTMSFATRAKVGALIVKDGRPITSGWNGMPSGFPNDEIEQTLADGSVVTNPLVLHAESNALMKCSSYEGTSTAGATLYVSMSPCIDCCKLIIQSKIAKVVYRTQYRDSSPLQALRRAGIIVEQRERDDRT